MEQQTQQNDLITLSSKLNQLNQFLRQHPRRRLPTLFTPFEFVGLLGSYALIPSPFYAQFLFKSIPQLNIRRKSLISFGLFILIESVHMTTVISRILDKFEQSKVDGDPDAFFT